MFINQPLLIDTYLLQFIFKDLLKVHTIILIGSLLQLLLCITLPLRWAAVPPCVILLNSIITTILQTISKRPNEYTERVIPARVTAQLPYKDGSFGTQPAAQPIVVFNIGVQYNHPLGLFAPGVWEVAQRFIAMSKDIKKRREELGLLGTCYWRADERRSNNTLAVTFYFKDVESIHKFAHEPMHREAWNFYDPKKHRHIGIFHETFCVPAKAYETIYANCHPVGMGRTSTKIESKGDEASWLNSLVNADIPALKTQYARLSRHEDGAPKEGKVEG